VATKDVRFDITAKDKTFKAVNSAKRHLKGLQSAVFSIKGAITGAFAVAGVVALARFTRSAIQAADEIAKTSDVIGITTDSLQELRHAADLSGVSNERLDKSLAQFTRRVGEARAGTGSLVTFLKKFDEGLLNSITSAKSNTHAIDLLFKALDKVENAADRSALAFAAFGRAGPELNVLLRDGLGGFQAMREEARKLGLVISEDLLRQAEIANDQLTRLEKVIGIKLTAAIVSLSPQISELAQRFIDAIPAIVKFGGKLADLAGFGAKSPSQEIADLNDQIDELKQKARDIILNGGTLADTEGIARVIAAMRIHIEKLETSIEAAKTLKKTRGLDQDGGGQTDPQSFGFKDTALKALRKEQKAIRKAEMAATKKAVADGQAMLDRLRENAITATRDQVLIIQTRREQELKALDDVILKEEETADARRLINERAQLDIMEVNKRAQEKMRDDTLKTAQSQQQAFESTFSSVGHSVSGATQDVLFYNKTWTEATADIARSLISSVISGLVDIGARMAANFAISKTLGTAASAAAVAEGATVAAAWAPAAAFAALATLGANAAPASAAIASTAALSQGIAFAGAREAGGPVLAGKSYMVGEAGPEMFTPGRSGSIASNDSITGGETIVINIDARGAEIGVEERVRTVLEGPGGRELVRQAAEQGADLVASRANQGGSYAKTLGRI